MKFAAFIITFNRPHILKATIDCILDQTRSPDFLLIVDNGNVIETANIVQSYQRDDIAYHNLGENLGPAGASAFALEHLAGKGYDWIYWGDDDDPPLSRSVLESLLNLAVSDKNPSTLGAVGGYGITFNWKTGEGKRIPEHAMKGIINVDSIGGGRQLILNSSVIHAIGLPNAQLFFGYEEPEYCLRIRRAGYRLLVDGAIMKQIRDADKKLYHPPQRSLIPPDSYQAIWRRYYTTRNYIFMMRNTFNRPDLARREALKSIVRVCMCWLRGPKYGAVFTPLQIRAIIDGYRGSLGRTIKPQSKRN